MDTSTPTKVAYYNIDNYNQDNVDRAIADILQQLGGIEQFVPQGSCVMIKANLVRDMHPDLAGTTHPAVITALARLVGERCKATVVVADSSGGAYTKSYMHIVYNRCKMTDVVDNTTNASLNQDFDYTNCSLDGVQLKNIDIINAFLNADVVINVAKLKTHSFAGYSGAVKNLYGLIPGLVKVETHSRYPDLGNFCDVLLDIEQFAKSKITLHVIDGIVGMEGEGPTNGKPKAIGKLIASANPYLLDYVATSLFCNAMTQPLLQKAQARGLLDISQLDFDMDSWSQYYITKFKRVDVIATNGFLNLPQWLARMLKSNLTQKVKIRKKVCRACRKCVEHCPNKAISIVNKKAHITQKNCIRCYCCQELCPFDAVALKKPLVYRVARTLSRTKK